MPLRMAGVASAQKSFALAMTPGDSRRMRARSAADSPPPAGWGPDARARTGTFVDEGGRRGAGADGAARSMAALGPEARGGACGATAGREPDCVTGRSERML